ncbi:hypothetical protein COV24_00420 [candidate division WWE3 bacterium CG10_big_fil_rev_8_21_14_0_10_32_10]|uniref:Lycopene cyclase domain-containing protein n=1 Tax=candidate division WWE3 bacterium CG10_big_fil_rev_8_21_14_0_10_32_10 TaxID=1975090 RepID=A0A2H0RBM7_UNCKA|nr:MAG: hypothetical protein COV24_00420 [candidate division WWE3 bacterium CG10_big_fil_rev_8_21_14_0_10_32_10]
MDTILIFRCLLPIIGFLGVILSVKFIKPPKKILYLSLRLGWIAGVLNLIVDAIQQHFKFWHYTVDNLYFGFPLDLYVSVSLVVGVVLPLIYWYLQSFNPKRLTLFILILPLYFLLQDYLVTKATGDRVLMLDSPYWWISDFLSLIVIVWGTLFIFNYFLSRINNQNSPS